ADGDLEFELGVNRIWNVSADIPLDAAGAEIRADEIVLKRLFLGDRRDVREPLDINLVVGQQPVVLVDDRIEMVEKYENFVAGLRSDIVADAADADVIIGQ